MSTHRWQLRHHEWESDPVLGHDVAWISEGDKVPCLLFRQDASAMLSYFRDHVGLKSAVESLAIWTPLWRR